MKSKVPRGGVAVYKNIRSEFNINVICDELRDCVVVKVRDTDLVIAAPYITPSNSAYYDEIYFSNLEMIYEKFHSCDLIFTGDMNSRVGNIRYDDILLNHKDNPDTTVNANGKKLLELIDRWKSMILLNGLVYGDKAFDSNFTCYKGTRCSQNDLSFCNNIEIIEELNIMPKYVYSDHCPIALTCSVRMVPSLDIVYRCSRDLLRYDHLDVNRRLLPPIKLCKLNVRSTMDMLHEKAVELQNKLTVQYVDNDSLSNMIASMIYNVCKMNYKPRNVEDVVSDVPNFQNCDSRNLKAIAEANLYTYNVLRDNGSADESHIRYLENWIKFQNLANVAENRELNTKRNKTWKNSKGDSKKLWSLVDWKGKAVKTTEETVYEEETQRYFSNIFQSSKTERHPILDDNIMFEIENYNVVDPSIDSAPTMEELEFALKSFGNGVGPDGIPGEIIPILPKSVKDLILLLMVRVFFGEYPSDWCKQILHSIPKHGHTKQNPKLRGIAVAYFLCRVYDTILNERFLLWYKPNYEQAGFRSGQGCALQYFLLILLISYARENKNTLYACFLDFEKAFDFANRPSILQQLMEHGCGKYLTAALAKTLGKTTYHPKINSQRLGEGIDSMFGVTQGRKTSSNLFSFYLSDMSTAFDSGNDSDFMSPCIFAQLADDTSLYAELLTSLRDRVIRMLGYSVKKYQIPNMTKTYYCEFAESPSLEPLILDENRSIDSVNDVDGYVLLGFTFLPTNDIQKIIEKNILIPKCVMLQNITVGSRTTTQPQLKLSYVFLTIACSDRYCTVAKHGVILLVYMLNSARSRRKH